MPTGPSALKDAMSRATSMIDSGDVDNALELLRTEAWALDHAPLESRNGWKIKPVKRTLYLYNGCWVRNYRTGS